MQSPAQPAKCPICLVALGGSAGALVAFQDLFENLTSPTGASFVIVQHMGPKQKSLLPELLSGFSRMPVLPARHGTRLERDHVYVVEPGMCLEVKEGCLQSLPIDQLPDTKYPIDHFFRSVSEAFGHCSIGVVFSGSGRDGAEGLRAIKQAGGLTYAQDPSEAKFMGMPEAAILGHAVDRVLPCEQIARSIAVQARVFTDQFAGTLVRVSETEDSQALSTVCRMLTERTGHDFSAYKKTTVARRVERRIQARRLGDLSSYVQLLEHDSTEAQALLNDLLISVTEFFRDPEAFRALNEQVIPRLFQRATQTGTVRVWVPACASGEEAYSLAILLKNYQREQVRAPLSIQIFATDIDRAALESARQGMYPLSIEKQVPPDDLRQYFTRHGELYQVKEDLREMCIFSEHSLIKNTPFSRIDLVSCRNLFIYWEPELQAKILPILHYALSPEGFLFMGAAESIGGVPELFRTIDKKHRIFQRVGGSSHSLFPFLSQAYRAHAQLPAVGGRLYTGEERDVSRVIASALLDSYAPPAVIVNEYGEIAFYSGRTGQYLQPPTGAPSNNLFDVVRAELRPPLHALVHRVIQTGKEVLNPGAFQGLDLIARPMPELGESLRLFMVIFQESPNVRSKTAEETERVVMSGPSSVVQQLETELRETREHLQSTIEEVKSSNEELLSMNEELQSANEELQTSKEELQSSNEELETVNAELSSKIEALDQANSDLQNFFQNTQVPTLFLDRRFRIQKFTPSTNQVFRLIPSDVGRLIADIASYLEEHDFLADFTRVLEDLQPLEREVKARDGQRDFIMRVGPYRTVADVINGVVVTFANVTEMKRAQQERGRLAAIVENSQDAIISKDLNAVITSWNKGAERMFGYTAAEMVGTPIFRIVPPDHPDDVMKILGAIGRGERVEHFETVRVHKDGHRIDVSLSVSPIRDVSGRIIGAAKIARDITERKVAEEIMHRSLKLRDEFISIASHELKTPLTSMKLQMELMRRKMVRKEPGALEPEQFMRVVEQTDRQLDRLTRLVDDMLDISRITSGKMELQVEPLDLSELARECLEQLGEYLRGAGCAVRADLPLGMRGKWDRARIEQVVVNLLTNAARYAKGKPVSVRVAQDGKFALLEIQDEGMGIAKKDHERIFERFERASEADMGGFGLGLYIVKEIIHAHGGTVVVESDLGRGALFRVRLPLEQ